MSLEIIVNKNLVESLNLSDVDRAIEKLIQEGEINKYEQQLQLKIDYPRDRDDPRELSEIPEVRLWFVRLDAKYPWLPFLLDWKTGELARYAAMLVPHQFSRSEGIQYNPEALEIFVMHKLFLLHNWLQQNKIPSQFRLKSMAQIFGYEIEDDFLKNL
jgi:hypothetical protein